MEYYIMPQLSVFPTLLKISPRVARILFIILGLISVAAIMAQYKIDSAELFNLALLFSVIAIVFFVASRFHGAISAILAWCIITFFSLYFLCFFVQTISINGLPIMEAGCYINPFEINCPAASPNKDGFSDSGRTIPDVPETADGPGSGPVYVQFAGALDRDTVKEVAEKLVTSGWNMQGADRGGERISTAYGKNEVRYFHPSDRELAERLAREFSTLAGWTDTLKIVDFSGEEFNVKSGYLEVWSSRI